MQNLLENNTILEIHYLLPYGMKKNVLSVISHTQIFEF